MPTLSEKLDRKLFQGYITLKKRNTIDGVIEGDGAVEVLGKTAFITFAKQNMKPLEISLNEYELCLKHYFTGGILKL